MSRHRYATKEINDSLDERYDDYYEEDVDEDYRPHKPLAVNMGNQIVISTSTSKKQSQQKKLARDKDKFLKKSKEIFGSKFTNEQLLEEFNKSNGADDAISRLMEIRDQLQPIKPDDYLSHGFAQGHRPPTAKAASTTPSKPSAIIGTPTIPQFDSDKKNFGDHDKGAPLGLKNPTTPSPVISRNNSRSDLNLKKSPSKLGLTPTTSSGFLNKMAALSDDDFDVIEVAEQGRRPHLALVVAGHVDAGKSTLVGNLLYKMGKVGQRVIHKYEKDAQSAGKNSFFLAWVLDESDAERSHGATIGVAEKFLSTPNKDFTVLDAPGHRDFIPNMIKGANQADVALLVVPATAGEFESSMGDNAQTREHAVILKALGVNQVIVIVNKMDQTQPNPWSFERFSMIQTELMKILLGLRFGEKAIRFVPVSGLEGINLHQPCPENCPMSSWYHGPCLIDMMDTFREPERLIKVPLRAVITTMLTTKGYEAKVSVLQGRLRRNRGVAISHIQGAFDVKRITKEDGEVVDTLYAGEEATVLLTDRCNRSLEEVKMTEGLVLYKGPSIPKCSRVLRCTIITMSNLQPPIIPGSSFEMYLHGEEVQCYIRRIYNISTGSSSVEKPKCMPGDRSGEVKIELMNTVCIEEFIQCKALGRFALRSKGRTCAVGICDKVL